MSSIVMTDPAQKTRDVHQMFVQCWASVVEGGPTLIQHLVNVSCLLGGISGGPDPTFQICIVQIAYTLIFAN